LCNTAAVLSAAAVTAAAATAAAAAAAAAAIVAWQAAAGRQHNRQHSVAVYINSCLCDSSTWMPSTWCADLQQSNCIDCHVAACMRGAHCAATTHVVVAFVMRNMQPAATWLT
jgi:hypothetical protein